MKTLADAIERASKNYTRSVTIPNGDVRAVVELLRVGEKQKEHERWLWENLPR